MSKGIIFVLDRVRAEEVTTQLAKPLIIKVGKAVTARVKQLSAISDFESISGIGEANKYGGERYYSSTTLMSGRDNGYNRENWLKENNSSIMSAARKALK